MSEDDKKKMEEYGSQVMTQYLTNVRGLINSRVSTRMKLEEDMIPSVQINYQRKREPIGLLDYSLN
jgi:hypothetical protein